jgi:NitT/TauT family transport system permease protein/taurine transport system permease protein
MMALQRFFGVWLRAADRFPLLATLGPFLPLLLLWWAVAAVGLFPKAFFPGPLEVAARGVELAAKGILGAYLEDSLLRLVVGAAAGIAVGLPLGLLLGLSDRAHRALWPLVLFFQAIGDIAWLPILIVWFGFGLGTMTFVIVYTVAFPVLMNTALGVRTIPETLPRAAASLGASPARIVLEVVLPGALPNIVTGLRNGLGFGWRALVAAEIIVGTSGIGFMMFDARRAGSVPEVVVGLVVLGIVWSIVDSWILAPLEKATGERWGLVSR